MVNQASSRTVYVGPSPLSAPRPRPAPRARPQGAYGLPFSPPPRHPPHALSRLGHTRAKLYTAPPPRAILVRPITQMICERAGCELLYPNLPKKSTRTHFVNNKSIGLSLSLS